MSRDSVFNFEKSEVNPIYKDENKLFVNFFPNSIRCRMWRFTECHNDWGLGLWLAERKVNFELCPTFNTANSISLDLVPHGTGSHVLDWFSVIRYLYFFQSKYDSIVKSRVHWKKIFEHLYMFCVKVFSIRQSKVMSKYYQSDIALYIQAVMLHFQPNGFVILEDN